jgi:hypothetical protein
LLVFATAIILTACSTWDAAPWYHDTPEQQAVMLNQWDQERAANQEVQDEQYFQQREAALHKN